MNLVQQIRRNRRISFKVPTLILGKPGVGKSDCVHQAADGNEVIDIRISLLDPVDLRGLPVVNRGEDGSPLVTWAKPDFLREGSGILFFDELNCAPPASQNAALQIMLDRKCGSHRLGDGWYIVGAGNKASHKAHVSPLSAPLRNRFNIIDFEPSVEDWTNWAMANGIHDDIIGFVNFRPALLSTLPKDEYSNFASPRTWAFTSEYVKDGVEDQQDLIGLIGEAASHEFVAYRNEVKFMPNIDALLEGRASFTEEEKRISISFALAMALSSRLLREKKDFINKYAERCAEIVSGMSPEIACLFYVRSMKGSVEVKEALTKSRATFKWVKAHEPLLKKYGVSESE
jgi:hypothetical protein